MTVEPATAADTAALRLTTILTHDLPNALGTPEAPDRYIVPVVFSRRVTNEEKGRIESAAVRDELAEKGYPGINLTVADRRLLIANTSLEQLGEGLAQCLATILDSTEDHLQRQREQRAEQARTAKDAEDERIATIEQMAASVSFDVPAALTTS